ncbi:MAG: tRNA lysidine(34) synthetase TilS [Clostridia bacterium]|nr:tRNA lysidine(34) synthetase TilS [Clostridia bacterium]
MNDLVRRMPELPRRVTAGISGGADSVALLHLLLAKGCSVEAVHVNHGLRGESSDGDEAFVRALCAEKQVKLRVYRLQPPENPGEGWARQERYRCFREAVACGGTEALTLAHHRDDQAETLLMHLMRGAGLNGLCGMAEDSEAQGMRILRPLLGFSRQELQGVLEARGIPWREDGSNQDPRYLRNAVRLQLLPVMEQLSPGCGARIAAAAQLLQGDNAALEAVCGEYLQRWSKGNCLLLEPLLRQPESLRRRILRMWWLEQAGKNMEERSLSQRQTEAFAALAHACAGEQCNLPGGWYGYRGWTHLHLIPPCGTETDAAWCGSLPQGCTVRTRQPGDWLMLRGGRRSLQDFFTDRKIDAPFRSRIPLLCRDDQVLAIAGIWQAAEAGEARWQGDMPWINA